MDKKQSLITVIILLIISILFVPIDRLDIVASLIGVAGILGLIYWWIK
jgi:hypothetical protein